MHENKQPNVCPDPQKALLDEVLCPGCGKFVGAYEKCPYCGTEMKKRISIIFFKRAALVLAFGGLALLWFTATRMQPQLIRIADINPRWNNAVVQIKGTVQNMRAKGKDISFFVNDGSEEIKVQAFRQLPALQKLGNVPHNGDQIDLVGQVQVTEQYGPGIMINVPSRVHVIPMKVEKVTLDKVTLENKGKLVQVTGEIVVADTKDIGTFLTIGDATGMAEVPLFSRDIGWMKDKERFTTVGKEITVIGTIDEYKGKPQIRVRDPKEIVTLTEDTIPAQKIPGYEEAVQKAKDIQKKMSPNMKAAEENAEQQGIASY